jgi:hypothetical protein
MAANRSKKAKQERRNARRKERRESGTAGSVRAADSQPVGLVRDADASPELRAAMAQIDRLVRLVPGPIRVTSTSHTNPRELHNWDVVAPAMLFSAANCLLSLRWLAMAGAPRREQDASVLLRRLYEHVVDFAWIAIDPVVNAKKWVSDDYWYRIKIDNEMTLLGQPVLDPTVRVGYEAYISDNGRMPDLASRAEAADRHWSTRVANHGTFPKIAAAPGTSLQTVQAGRWSLRTEYTLIYRSASANAHPTPLSLHTYVHGGSKPGTFIIGAKPHDTEDRFAYTLAPLVYATLLLIAEQALGYPRADDVFAAFRS